MDQFFQRVVYRALLSRQVEQKLLDLYNQGKLSGTVHTSIGQEFSGAVVCSLLEQGDTVFSNHRCHGHFLSRTEDAKGLISEIMGKAAGVCGGKGGSQHLCKDGFFSNGIQGGILPVAAGLALAHKLKRSENISVVFIGDGTLGEGAVYETLNIASKWKLPLLVVLENNEIAQSTPSSLTLAGNICARAAAFGLKTSQSNTWEWKELAQTTRELVLGIRKSSEPAFLQIDTFRLKAHSKGDDTRSPNEIAPYEAKDPLNLIVKNASPEVKDLLGKVELVVQEATQFAEEAPWPTLKLNCETTKIPNWQKIELPNLRFGVALNDFFKSFMKSHPEILFIGEDVLSPYGGAFKIAQDLSTLYPNQVFTTPISEAAITGLGAGLAIKGFRPFIEIMFGDFTTLIFDQLLNHAAKFADMYNGQVLPNLVVRTPMGGGRAYGPTHSQSLEKHFLGIPGLRVLSPNLFIDPRIFYAPLIKGETGVSLVCENKKMYAQFLGESLSSSFSVWHSQEEFPCVWIRPDATKVHLTIIAHGGTTSLLPEILESLFVNHDIIAQALCPTELYPFNAESYRDIFSQAPYLLCLEEGQGFSSFASEVISQISALETDLKCVKYAALSHCIPASPKLEKETLPSLDSIVEFAKLLVRGIS